MTELEQTIDQTVGNETEHTRTTYLRFVALGRQLEGEARLTQGQFSKEQVDAAIKTACAHLFDAFMAIEMEAGKAAAEVEKVDEDEAFEKLKTNSVADFGMFEALLNTVDQKHTAIIKAKQEKLEALKATLG